MLVGGTYQDVAPSLRDVSEWHLSRCYAMLVGGTYQEVLWGSLASADGRANQLRTMGVANAGDCYSFVEPDLVCN